MQLGVENVTQELSRSWGKCALLSNQASVLQSLQSSRVHLQDILGERLTKLFSPQHGYYATEQDNMLETSHGHDPQSGLPIFSLYSQTREPTEEMLEDIDTVIIDLQIVGCRVYTFKATVRNFLQAAKKYQKRIVVLDRPNPLGGIVVSGRCPSPDRLSFVAPDVIPMRHGMSVGECANYFNRQFEANLEVVNMTGWNPELGWEQMSIPWVYTSPNLPCYDGVVVYPGAVMLEGVSVSEGRGTTLPFQVIGLPDMDSRQFTSRVSEHMGSAQDGYFLREVLFRPTFNKWVDRVCSGVHLVVTEPSKVHSYKLGLSLIKAAKECSEHFSWATPPYEYEYEKSPFSLIVGHRDAESKLSTVSVEDDFFHHGVEPFVKDVKPYLLYPRDMQVQ